MERRNFIKTSCNICLLGAAGVSLLEMAGCGAAYPVFKTEVQNKQLQVPLSLFDTSTTQFIRPKGWYYDIAVEKKDGQYFALLLQCTHQDNQLTVNGSNSYQCSLHGSVFDKEGKVKKGPAEKALHQYKTRVENNQLIINV
ncbi:ubiquinol-cytochrome c reductase iron-sulfur subunit [Parasediminibacterium sp. JCM 36343]|uniref:QcrA and Rieske domain-containing protein n=1 Tax=Parasediminibacterium sp. JCM 36343 TaxID=3374279 RepID=UPI00397B8CE3